MTQAILLTGLAWTFLAAIVAFVVLPTIRSVVRDVQWSRRLREIKREMAEATKEQRLRERELGAVISLTESRKAGIR
jgi:hypothetical protein